MALGKAVEQHVFSRRVLAMSLDGSDGQAVPVTATWLLIAARLPVWSTL